MNNSLQRVKPVRSRLKEQRLLQRWEQIRAKGKARFVFGGALAYGLSMAGIADVIDDVFIGNVFIGGTQFSTLLYHAIVFSVTGIVVPYVTWWDMERKYKAALKAALIDARVKASPSGELPPHSNPSKTTAD